MGLSESCRSWRPGSRGVGTSGTSDFEKTAGWSRAAFLCICRKNHTSMSNTLGQKQASWGHAYDEAVMTLASCYACVPALACCRSIIATAMATYTQLHLGGALTRSLLVALAKVWRELSVACRLALPVVGNCAACVDVVAASIVKQSRASMHAGRRPIWSICCLLHAAPVQAQHYVHELQLHLITHTGLKYAG